MSRLFTILGWLLAIVLAALVAFVWFYHQTKFDYITPPAQHLFAVQSIDTMKDSLDMSDQILADPAAFKSMIDTQMQLIADAGATHVAIDTPYDPQFLPVLELWVASARSHDLSVFFRGNFSGWDGWFNYPPITEAAHEQMLKSFLQNNPNLFQSGDVFTPCTECENGGPGDPRQTGDAAGFNQFLVAEINIAAGAFAEQGKNIAVYPAMNGDIARQIIMPATVSAFGGTILIDHYVSSAQQFASDIAAIPKQLHANVGLGEFGAPIPDLNGDMTEAQQAGYIDSLLRAMYQNRATIPLANYWTLTDSSTAIVNDDGALTPAYTIIQNYFKAFNVYGIVYNSLGEDVKGADVSIDGMDYAATSTDGIYQIFVPRQYTSVTIGAAGYTPITLTMPSNATTTMLRQDVYLQPTNPSWWYKMRAYLYTKFHLG
jgi:hypothetical protein